MRNLLIAVVLQANYQKWLFDRYCAPWARVRTVFIDSCPRKIKRIVEG